MSFAQVENLPSLNWMYTLRVMDFHFIFKWETFVSHNYLLPISQAKERSWELFRKEDDCETVVRG